MLYTKYILANNWVDIPRCYQQLYGFDSSQNSSENGYFSHFKCISKSIWINVTQLLRWFYFDGIICRNMQDYTTQMDLAYKTWKGFL